jgi:hypothetical protein
MPGKEKERIIIPFPIEQQLGSLRLYFKIVKLRDELTPPEPPQILEMEGNIISALNLGITGKVFAMEDFMKVANITTKEQLGNFSKKLGQEGKVQIFDTTQRAAAIDFLIEKLPDRSVV